VNGTGADIGCVAGKAPSTLEIFMPVFFQASDLQKMKTDLADWIFSYNADDVSLMLTYGGAGATWASGQPLAFTITGVQSNAAPAPGSIQINLTQFNGNVPPSAQTPLSLTNEPKPGNAKLTDVLAVCLDNQGAVIVSVAGDPLQNTLLLNFKNTGATELYSGKAMWTGKPKVQVMFIYGSTSGALAPSDKTAPAVGSAWSIVVANAFSEGNVWVPANPSKTDPIPDPIWTLVPANNNQGIIGIGDSANITFSFSNIVSLTPPGHTQMIVHFSGFMKDETTPYDDAVFVLDIVKQTAPATRGLMNFSSLNSVYPVTRPDQAVEIQLRWRMFDVASVNLIVGYPGIPLTPIQYPHVPQIIANDSGKVTIPGTSQSIVVPITLQAYDGNTGYLNGLQFSAFIQANMFVDPRDGKVYPVVQVKNRLWMAANLDHVDAKGSYSYNDLPVNEPKYGRLYTADAPSTQFPPGGWRIPSQDDWQALFDSHGDSHAAYEALIDGGSSGFNAQLGGYRDDSGSFSNLTAYGYYRSSAVNGGLFAGFSRKSETVNLVGTFSLDFAISIRYVRDL
jgi:uncharacterized protein (TIGR02145 family)